MPHASIKDIKISVLAGSQMFRTLGDFELIMNPAFPSEPLFRTGGLAIVFKIKLEKDQKFYALKCFYKDVPDRIERLNAISEYIQKHPNPYFVDLKVLEDEIWVNSGEHGAAYPIVLMEWVEGITLDKYVEKLCKEYDKYLLKYLYYRFCKMALFLEQQDFAHGDLKHDNILILENGDIKWVDYDGMFVPELTYVYASDYRSRHKRKSTELGSPGYRQPSRSTDQYHSQLDIFSLKVLLTSLSILVDDPYLYFRLKKAEGLVFEENDLMNINTHTWNIINSWINKIYESRIETKTLVQDLQASITKAEDILDEIVTKEYLFYHRRFQFLEPSISEKEKQFAKNILLNYPDLVQYGVFYFAKKRGASFLENSNIQVLSKNWDWEELSNKQFLPWSEAIINQFQDKWNWEELSNNRTLPWSVELIEKYKSNWSWRYLSSNKTLP